MNWNFHGAEKHLWMGWNSTAKGWIYTIPSAVPFASRLIWSGCAPKKKTPHCKSMNCWCVSCRKRERAAKCAMHPCPCRPNTVFATNVCTNAAKPRSKIPRNRKRVARKFTIYRMIFVDNAENTQYSEPEKGAALAAV